MNGASTLDDMLALLGLAVAERSAAGEVEVVGEREGVLGAVHVHVHKWSWCGVVCVVWCGVVYPCVLEFLWSV